MTDALGIEARKTKLLAKLEENPHLAGSIIFGFIRACLLQSKSISDIQSVILATLQIDAVKQNPDLVFNIIDSFTQPCLSQGKTILDIKPVILEAVKQNPNLASAIIFGFTQVCLVKGKPISEIQPVILEAIKQNPDLAFDIIDGFTKACLSQNKLILEIQSLISEAIRQNPDLAFDIISGFTQACLFQGKLIPDIQPVILEAIKQNPDLAFSIINGFTQACLSKGKIKELIPVFQNLLEEAQKPEFSVKNKTLLINQIKSFSIPILSQYLQDTLLTLKDESSLSKKDRDISAENELLGLFKSLYPEVFKDIKTFEDIKLKDLIPIWQIFFVNKIKIQTINGGDLYELLPFIFDIFKGQDLTIGQLFTDIKPLLQNFYYINLNCEEGKEQLKKIKEESEKPENKNKSFIVYTDFPDHAVVSIIQNGQISIIDSSHVIFHTDYPQYQQILRDCGFKDTNIRYFNTTRYQKNGTCYLDAILALKWIMEKFLSKQKDKKPEDISPATLNSILSNLEKETGIELPQITIKLQQIVVDIVSQLVKFYETLQQPITERYIADVKVLEEAASVKTLTTTTTTTTTTATKPETEFTEIGGTTPQSSKTSKEAVADIEKEELQRELGLSTITKNELAIMPQIIAAIIANTSIAAISTIFGTIPEVQKNVAVIKKAQEEAAKSTSQGIAA